MAIMTERDLECFLCGEKFRMVYGDLIFAPEIICDACRQELEPLADADLLPRVTERMAQRGLVDPQTAGYVLQVIHRPRPGLSPFGPGLKQDKQD
jgi:hypothetical protein